MTDSWEAEEVDEDDNWWDQLLGSDAVVADGRKTGKWGDPELKHDGPALSFCSSYYIDFFEAKLLNKLLSQKNRLMKKYHTVIQNKEAMNEFIHDMEDRGYKVFHIDETLFVLNKKTLNYCKFWINEHGDDPYTIRILGNKEWVNELETEIISRFKKLDSYIKWYYDAEGHSIVLPLSTEKLPVKEMYPFLKEDTLEEYYQKYLDSGASVLILIGPPGTGKTTFIRGLLHYANAAALVSYDEAILQRDSFFANYIANNKERFMIIEDCDTMIRSREDNNGMMHKFLNISDGLVAKTDKKIIFSTNLEATKDIDSALLRPGRCFGVLEFSKLNNDQALALAEKMGVSLDNSSSNSIAEILCPKYDISKDALGKVGFIK